MELWKEIKELFKSLSSSIEKLGSGALAMIVLAVVIIVLAYFAVNAKNEEIANKLITITSFLSGGLIAIAFRTFFNR